MRFFSRVFSVAFLSLSLPLCVHLGVIEQMDSSIAQLTAEELKKVIPDATLSIPMRDGTRLPASLFLPSQTSEKKFPCILVRHPLGREHVDPAWFEFLSHGYALVVQSTRSACDPEGKMVPYVTDGWSDSQQPADGHDTVQWITSSDFCNGRVATIGASATGITQFLMAPSSPPGLCCQFIEMAAPSMYQYAVYPGGVFRKEQVEGWLKLHGRAPSVLEWLGGKTRYDTFWSQFNALDFTDLIRVPQLHVGGWYDIFLQGTIDAYVAGNSLSHPAVRNQHKLIIGPWGHRWRTSGKLADQPLSQEQLTPPCTITSKDWIDFHLKGVKNAVSRAPKIQYYVMGPFDGTRSKGNVWRTSDVWPPKGTEEKKFTIGRSGTLARSAANVDWAEESYKVLFHGNNPVPTIGGRNLFMADGPRDLRSIVGRDDVVLFSSEELKEDTEVTGRIWAHLHVGEVQQERAVCLRVVDISPQGSHHIVAEGVALVPAKSSDDAKQTQQGDVRLVIVDLWSTSFVFAKGHKIGLVATATNYPAYGISGSPSEECVAFTIHSSKKHPSSLVLPIMQ